MSKRGLDTAKLWESYFDAFKRHDWQKSLSILESLSEASPEDPNVALKVGDILQRLGRPSEAVSAYHKAAWLLVKKGFHQKALAIYKLILRIEPQNEEAIKQSTSLLMQIEAERASTTEYVPTAPEPEPEKEPTFSSPYGVPESEEIPIERTSVVEEGTTQFPSLSFPEETTTEEFIPSAFSSLSKEDALEVIKSGTLRHYDEGSYIIEEGDTGDSMFVIKSGRAKVIAHILGKEIELAVLEKGDVFGEVAFLTGRPRTASVIALTPLDAIEIDRASLEDAIEKNPRILERIQDFFHSRVQDTIKKVKKK